MKHLFCVLPLALAGSLAGSLAIAAPLVQTQSLAGQVLLQAGSMSVVDTSADNAAPVLSRSLQTAFTGFDAATGVLVGASGAMSIDAGHGLQAYRTESGGNWDSVATVRAIWRLNGSLLAGTGTGWLARTVSNRDTLVVTGTDWNGLSFGSSGSALDAFVGAGALNATFETSLSAFIDDGGGGSVAIASVLSTAGGTPTADPDGLTAGIDWSYSYLRHSQVSFDSGADISALSLDLGGSAQSFTLHALGDAATTGADIGVWSCSGDCAAFSLSLAAADGLQAGASTGGQVSFLGGSGPVSARYFFTAADDDAVGAASTRLARTLTLDVSVSAVPEPGSWALMLAGLGCVGLKRRRDR
jgi:hypothetical protein